MPSAHDPAVALLRQRLAVALFRPKFAENVGSTARACLNMGCERILLVAPRNYAPELARPLATGPADPLLDQARVFADLSSAVAPFTQVYGTTARLGGRRATLLTPAQAARQIVDQMLEGHDVALLFGPEDRGLTNAEIDRCTHLISIPTATPNVSLNLAQAVLLILYECLQAARSAPSPTPKPLQADFVDHAEQEALFAALRHLLTTIDFLPKTNPDYGMLRLRRLWHRLGMRRSEYALLMGICRQMQWALGNKKRDE
ncbi:RNA methyltransferase [Desulfonatronum sp. SC1]|uniref:RNA methyltransferase n=1 Tax=Desulfonatronum sp. SC1 TaxID=2109626 RepID=UPI000D31DCC9|nr:RNA methyltransferase [Desulfonatronum sp. SC1]PTN39106.1 rRNA methyltransferase [Desulfonatronum sp. SC1]